MRSLLHWPTAVSVPAIVASVLVAATVGVIFGFYPAAIINLIERSLGTLIQPFQ